MHTVQCHSDPAFPPRTLRTDLPRLGLPVHPSREAAAVAPHETTSRGRFKEGRQEQGEGQEGH